MSGKNSLLGMSRSIVTANGFSNDTSGINILVKRRIKSNLGPLEFVVSSSVIEVTLRVRFL